jgi:hypothetical protein
MTRNTDHGILINTYKEDCGRRDGGRRGPIPQFDCMKPDAVPFTSNFLKGRNPDEFREVEDFRARFEEMLLVKLDDVIDNSHFRDRGHFLPPEDVKAIAQVLHVLTRDSWTNADLDRFDTSWRDAMQSDFFAEAFESIRFRIENAVRSARARLAESRGAVNYEQGELW